MLKSKCFRRRLLVARSLGGHGNATRIPLSRPRGSPSNPNLLNNKVQILSSNLQNDKVQNLLDGCYHVYIDVGTNVGIQIRKLFEPEKYPDANVHKVFDTKFGNIKERLRPTIDGGNMICAIGFEPNSHHTEQLVKIESAYQQCGWRVVIFTESAASDRNGVGKFYTDCL